MTDSDSPVILLVNDDDAKRYSVVRELKLHGFSVVEAANGQDALRLSREQPDLILLDVMLPDISGLEVCARIKADPATARIPVVHLSATLVQLEDKVQGLESGADAYLTDFTDPMEVIATIRALLRARRAEDSVREHEQRFRMLVQNIKDYAIFMMDPDGTIISWNEGVERNLGFMESEFIGQHGKLIFTPEDIAAEAADQEFKTAREQGRAQDERWHLRKDGSRFFASGILTSMRNDRGQLLGFAKIMRDITDRKRAEEERLQLLASEQAARAEAENANRLKDEFLATLSHELRTPLMAILGWSEILQAGRYDPQELEQGLATIARNAKAQAQLIEDLLDVSRIISGKLRLDVHTVELTPVIEAALESVQTAADAKGIQLSKDLDAAAGPVSADAGRLQQVIWNLLSNAIKFTPRSGRVEVRLARVNTHVEITVSDTGQGIDTEFLPYVFERFRQADASTRRPHAGLGLGLAIVRHLSELHGGSVHAESAGLGQGAAFTVRLPMATASPVPAIQPSETPTDEDRDSDCTPNLAGLSVLVVDDEPDARELLRRVLQQCDALVHVAGSAAEGLRLFEKHRPDMLISDIGMPGEDGYDLIRQIRAHEGGGNPRMPAVALTAFARSEDRRRAMLAGFQVHMPKPVMPSELIAVVASLAGRTG